MKENFNFVHGKSLESNLRVLPSAVDTFLSPC